MFNAKYTPEARIILRYLIGGAFFNSPMLGEMLASSPYVVALVSALIGGALEAYYKIAKARGWPT